MPGKVLITGAAGFIGFHLTKRLLTEGVSVTGFDNVNDYYDPSLKESRLALLQKSPNFTFVRGDLQDRKLVTEVTSQGFETVINLAAQAGVRYSLINPHAYIDSNVTGFLNILEACRAHKPAHLIFASSSSVYGANRNMPFSVHNGVDHPLAMYAASKKANELMAHSYANLFGIPCTGLRFFTVYGPYGRPDMALFIFTKAILENKPIDIFNYGRMRRDFTYVDDIVEGIVRLMPLPPQGNPEWNAANPDPATSFAPYRLLNIGNSQPEDLLHFIEVLENKLGKKAIKNFLPLQDGDVAATFADMSDLEKLTGFKPRTSIEKGIGNFVDWYLSYTKGKG